eukprot:TRINITY_DN8406_c0_g1_i1.p1 TRINITY_DN8406_c0_g1~~TRINITY_DN8406_c0_g1_i1.p1  ORF type:complete len:139 (+),score=8.09 TRINITY_DN8406_c0_g1_i1:92-508(+)
MTRIISYIIKLLSLCLLVLVTMAVGIKLIFEVIIFFILLGAVTGTAIFIIAKYHLTERFDYFKEYFDLLPKPSYIISEIQQELLQKQNTDNLAFSMNFSQLSPSPGSSMNDSFNFAGRSSFTSSSSFSDRGDQSLTNS